jgi:hypothetical protein
VPASVATSHTSPPGSVKNAGATPALAARWAVSPVTVDGRGVDDWADAEMAGIAGLQLSLGAQVDAQSLYIALITQDAQQAALLARRGFTLWFDSGGGNAKGTALDVPAAITDDSGQSSSGRPGTAVSATSPIAVPQYVTIHSAGQPGRVVPSVGGTDVAMAAGTDSGIFCYEIRMSLSAIGATLGHRLAVGIRALVPFRPEHRGATGEHAGGRGHGGMRGGGHRGMGGMGGAGGGGGGASSGGQPPPDQGGSAPDHAKPTPAMGVESWLQITLPMPPTSPK